MRAAALIMILISKITFFFLKHAEGKRNNLSDKILIVSHTNGQSSNWFGCIESI